MKKLSVFECHRRFKEGEKMCKMTQEVGSQKCSCDKGTTGDSTVLFGSADKVMGICSEEKTQNSGLKSGFSTMTILLCMMC
jgi:hypothetical protein